MKTLSSEFKGRVDHWIRTLQNDFYEPVGKLSWEMFTTMEELSLEEAMTREYMPVEPGFTWGHTWNTAGLGHRLPYPSAVRENA